ncbi:MAG: TetR family transcriptional regulator [Candidatus Limnocylindrales bacterium]|jgi:AcrR family transcriptional regulator
MQRDNEVTERLRVDAERNRSRIVEAAQADFAEHGLDVPLEAVAEHAGVGIATLYRRFPTREALIAACFERRLEEYARAAEEALEASDGWSGFCGYAERVCSMQAADLGFNDVLTRTFSNAKKLEEQRARGYELSVRMVERAQAEGTLRSDFVPEDLVLMLMANAGVVQGAGRAAPDAWRRLVGLMLDGFRSEGATELPSPPTPRQMVTAMRRLAKPTDETRSMS